MSTHIYEIGDGTGTAFKIKIESPFWARFTKGSWRTLDKGFIRYNSGKTEQVERKKSQFIQERDVFLLSKEGTWGIRLNEFTSQYSVHDQGTGELRQPWALQAKPGKISWVRVSSA